MCWSGEQGGFVIAAFFINDSVTATQRAFRTRFGLNATDAVPDRKTILRWVWNVNASGSALPRKPSTYVRYSWGSCRHSPSDDQQLKTLENGFGSASRITGAIWMMLFSNPNKEKTRLYVLFENTKFFSVTCSVRFLLPLKYWSQFCRTLYLRYIYVLWPLNYRIKVSPKRYVS